MKTILVVDDEFLLADMTAILLEDAGYAAVQAYDGRKALDAIDGTPPALVITDFMMPVMTGLELAETIKSRPQLAGLPIILVSGAQGAIARAHPNLFAAVLDKPYSHQKLLQIVENLIGPSDG